jgi:hypothetical protein
MGLASPGSLPLTSRPTPPQGNQHGEVARVAIRTYRNFEVKFYIRSESDFGLNKAFTGRNSVDTGNAKNPLNLKLETLDRLATGSGFVENR